MNIVDRRLNSSGQSTSNRKRLFDRARASVKRSITKQIGSKKVTSEDGERVLIPEDDIQEPVFGRSLIGGNRTYILPGNKEFVVGDTLPKPEGGGGGGGGAGSNAGGEEEYELALSEEEVDDVFFEFFELPNLTKVHQGNTEEFEHRRAGFQKHGPSARLDSLETMRKSIERRVRLARPKQEDIDALEQEISLLDAWLDTESKVAIGLSEMRAHLEKLKQKRKTIPFIDPDHDLKFRRVEMVPKPITQAVMFCPADMSGSITDEQVQIMWVFYRILYKFLKRSYRTVDIVWIRHTHVAEEVDEETFFTSRTSGGTVVSTALELSLRIMEERYSADWNIYVAQVSDGENSTDDMARVYECMQNILPRVQYYAYIELSERGNSELWKVYAKLPHSVLTQQYVSGMNDVPKVFHRLFGKKETT